MDDKLRAAFDSVHAEEALKERTMAFLAHADAEAPARRRPAGRLRRTIAAAVACLLVLVVFGYVQLFEATSEVSKLENQLSALQSQQTQLQSRYEARIDLDAIETAAGDLGLTKPSQEQIVYLDLSGADRAEIYQEEKTSVFSEIVSAMEQSVSGLIAYLRTASA